MKNTKQRRRHRATASAPTGPAMIAAGSDCPACGGTMYRLLDERSRPRCLDCEPLAGED